MRGHLTKEQRLCQVVTRLKHENAKLRERIMVLEKENGELKQQLQYVMMQMEELKAKVFGKKKQRDNDEDDHSASPSLPRAPHTYRRPIPTEDEITTTKEFQIFCCKQCATPLTSLKIITRYQEDILPPAQWEKALKVMERHRITTGYCSQGKERIAAIPITKQTVTIGANLKQFSTYANIILRLSFHQIKSFLADTVHLSLSDGEIANILDEHARMLIPEVQQMTTRIHLQSGAHYDETGWRVQQEKQGGYGWVMTGTQTPDTVFLLGRSRGKGNAEELQGDTYAKQVGITDDYGAYRNLFFRHQLCWAHPLRKLRELKESDHLSSEERIHCSTTYESFANLYEELHTLSATPFVFEERVQKKKLLSQRFFDITFPHIRDPVRLGKIKASLRQQQESYFTCLTTPGIPPDNNKAERALRHLVLKRKNCYGSKTQKGAETMSILFSVMLSLWWKKPKNFFAEFSHLLNPLMT